MADAKTTKFPFQELIEDNKLSITELPAKTQELINKFPSITDADAQDSMSIRIYGQIDDYMEKKIEAEKAEKTKAKIAETKKKKTTLDVSGAATAKSAEELAAEEAAKAKTDAPKTRSIMDTIYGRK